MAARLTSATDICEIQGCRELPRYWVGAGDVRRVCRRCMEELVSFAGWSLLDVIHHQKPAELASRTSQDV